jgi:catechol 2,3-dioxygenase-like lactoylglutathione lyase family enzyme
MLTESRIVYLFLYVTDLAASRAFYTEKVGLHVIEEDADSVKFDAGSVILALNRARDYGIELPRPRNQSTDIVFLVKDAEATRAVLERRGLTMLPTSAYQPGKIIDFYDPDGHWLSLYEPSKEAIGWPSGDRIRAVLKSREKRHAARAAAGHPIIAGGLDGSDIFYTFFFVADPNTARGFYNGTLGIRALEGGPCSQTCTGDEEGVIKYDTGSMLLTTHHAFGSMTPDMMIIAPASDDPDEHACPPRTIDMKLMHGVGAAFWVGDLDASVKALKQQRPDTKIRVHHNGIGGVATIHEPTGHLLFLYEPSEAALATPSGRKISEILSIPLPDRDLATLREMVPADEFKQDITWEGVPAC